MKSNYNLTYQLLNLDNLEIAYNIQKETWKDDKDYEDLKDKATNTRCDNCFFLVYDKDILIGITGVDVIKPYFDTIWLDWFTVLPQFRKMGYGEKILKDVINYCKQLQKFETFRVETTYYKDRPALFLYNKVMQLKEEYTLEDTKVKKNNTLIYSYSLTNKNVEKWNNKYLGLREYYDNLNS